MLWVEPSWLNEPNLVKKINQSIELIFFALLQITSQCYKKPDDNAAVA